jgi:hypothetical protein
MCGEIYCKDCRHKCKEDVNDREVEKLWEELGDVPFYEGEDGEMYLDVDWQGWDKGTDRETIWYWFDAKHSKGVAWLLYEYEG